MPIVVFTDIDDTLMQTLKKMPVDSNPEVGAVDKEGVALSYTTTQQRHLIKLMDSQDCIPVTGRNYDALSRVLLHFKGFKIIDHGAMVLGSDDQPLPEWLDRVKVSCEYWAPILEDYNAQVNAMIIEHQLSLRARVIFDYGQACYVSIKGLPRDLERLTDLSQRFCGLGDNARCHVNGHNMALLPPHTCKMKAVEFLKQYYLEKDPGTLFVAAGDSCSDLPFMSACHYAMLPVTSQIGKEKELF